MSRPSPAPALSRIAWRIPETMLSRIPSMKAAAKRRQKPARALVSAAVPSAERVPASIWPLCSPHVARSANREADRPAGLGRGRARNEADPGRGGQADADPGAGAREQEIARGDRP